MFALITGLSTGCADNSFSFKSTGGSAGTNPNGTGPGSDDATGSIPQDCSDQLQQLTIPIKLLFVVDTSGSNVNNNPGTDPNKVVRGQSIQEFFNTYKAKTNFNWGFLHFSGSTANALISNPYFTNNTVVVQGAINTFFNINDTGNTPYMAALNLAQTAINSDTNRTAQTKWVVVFLSDGMPNPDVAKTTLADKVSTIVGLIPGQITFNTVYYGPSNATAIDRLQAMAAAGGGKFVNTNNSGRSFPIEDVITVPGTSCR